VTRRALLPLALGAVAVLVGGWLVWRAWVHDDPPSATSAPRSTPQALRTTPLVDRAGGFRIRVPQGLHGRLDGHTALVARKDRSLLLVVAPSGPGSVRVPFSGRIGGKALRPGSYTASVTAIDGSGNRSKPDRVKFTVVKK